MLLSLEELIGDFLGTRDILKCFVEVTKIRVFGGQCTINPNHFWLAQVLGQGLISESSESL